MAAINRRPLSLNMDLDEEKIRQIVREAQRELGPNADPALLRKIIRDVIRELERHPTECDCMMDEISEQ